MSITFKFLLVLELKIAKQSVCNIDAITLCIRIKRIIKFYNKQHLLLCFTFFTNV